MRGFLPDLKSVANPATDWDALPVSLAIGYEYMRGLRRNLAQIIILPIDFDAVTTILSHSVGSESVFAS